MAEYIEREAAIDAVDQYFYKIIGLNPDICLDGIRSLPAADVVEIPEEGIEFLSDGYHTFNSLYFQRLVLTAALVKAYKDRAWKSWKHEDGEPCFGGGWFIVGIDTPLGSYTYHYEGKDFDLFECEELPVAKHWDGHTDAHVTRLLSLPGMAERAGWISVKERMPEDGKEVLAYEGGGFIYIDWCCEGEWVIASANSGVVTHWMPRPEPPGEKK